MRDIHRPTQLDNEVAHRSLARLDLSACFLEVSRGDRVDQQCAGLLEQLTQGGRDDQSGRVGVEWGGELLGGTSTPRDRRVGVARIHPTAGKHHCSGGEGHGHRTPHHPYLDTVVAVTTVDASRA
ncbi:hypothetical protein ACHMZP_30940 [Rhodococcus baikonurensis]|uniref:hypothetical protein n=1 Tax=Rhodococcus baikonurensis TaxID=172041 RepID=UPI0037BBC168